MKSQIVNAYKNFVETIRSTYPKAQIVCMLGNMDITKKGSPWPGYVEKAVAEINDPKIFTYIAPYKETYGHPKVNEQKILADGLIHFMDRAYKMVRKNKWNVFAVNKQKITFFVLI